MAIGGVVISVAPERRREVEASLARFSGVSIYGGDERGYIIAVVQGTGWQEIEDLLEQIRQMEAVREVSLAYLNENRAETPAVGEDGG